MSEHAARSAPTELHEWVARVTEALGVDAEAVDADEVLDLTRAVAHGVARPAGPVTMFLVGMAAGRSGGDRAAVADAVRAVRGLLPPGA